MRNFVLIFFILLLFLVLPALPAGAQVKVNSNLRHKNIPTWKLAGSSLWTLDTLSIVPGSVGIAVPDNYYKLDLAAGTFMWLKPWKEDSIGITYRVFPFLLSGRVQRYGFDSAMAGLVVSPTNITARGDQDGSLFNFGKIDYTGSFGRSMSFGNNQNAVFNSEFNLQMNGYIGDSIRLLAALTDDNIPIQPDGTTQQLNDFDKILLQFSKKNWEVNMGDIDLRADQSYFLNFYKRLQGVSYEQKIAFGTGVENKTIVSGAIAKGKFARNVLRVTEGNQGPYRLQGNNNELYFVVLAGTEKVYIDGELLQRGEDQDYTIDYNQAQISFTPRHLITRDSRVQVSFEYADRNYLNTMLYAQNETQFGRKLHMTVSAYSNADARNQPINQTLDGNKRAFLQGIGDSIQKAFYPYAEVDTFSTNKILYKKIDTLVDGRRDSIFVYSTSKDSARYNLYFAEVGPNKGNYVPYLNAANGKVFAWVAPAGGVPQGSYEPAEFLATPKKQQLLSVKMDYQIDSATLLTTELATSNTDINTFSTRDGGDNMGYAGKISLQKMNHWKSQNKKLYTLKTAAGFELETSGFRSIENLRPVEFARDWGLEILPENTGEKLGSFLIALSDDQQNQVSYNFQTYLRGDGYKGFRNRLTHHQVTGNGWHFDEDISMTSINMTDAKGYFLKPQLDISKQFKNWHNFILGASYGFEHNEVSDRITDSLHLTSFAFETLSAFIKSDPAKNNNWSIIYSARSNKIPSGTALQQTDHNRNLSFELSLLQNRSQQLKLSATYRELYVDQPDLIQGQLPDKSFLGRAAYFVHTKNGFITGNALYETGAGQEQKRDYSFYEVSPGQGQYTWKDYNQDGIQQLNEFEIAAFQDEATFIKIYTPTNVFVKADYTQFNYSFQLQPKVLFDAPDKWIEKWLTKATLLSSLQSAKKQLAHGGPAFNPFSSGVADSALLNYNYIFSNTLSVNQLSSKWGLNITRLINFNKSLLTYGSEANKVTSWDLKGRVGLSKAYTFEWEQKFEAHGLTTPAFANRNFNLRSISMIPTITYTNRTKWRVMGGYDYTKVQNESKYGGERSTRSTFQLESKYNAVQNTSLTGRFEYSHIDYTGDPNSAVSYNMLEGLLPGKNLRWTLELTKRLLNNLELSFQYEGRKSGESKLINIGRASIRAIL